MSDIATLSPSEDPRVMAFEELEPNAFAGEPQWVFDLRKAGIALFSTVGYPTKRDEDWRFSNVSAIADLEFLPSLKPAVEGDTGWLPNLKGLADKLPFREIDTHRLVFVDGHYAPHLSDPGSQEGVKIAALSQALDEDSSFLQDHLCSLSSNEKNGFSGLNQAFFSDGLVLHVPKGVQVEKPIEVVFVGYREGVTAHVRNLAVVEESAKVVVIETHVSDTNGVHMTNVVNEWFVGDNANAEHVKVQDQNKSSFHIGGFHSRSGRNSHLAHHSIALGALLSRNDLRTCLDGEGQNCVLNGLYITRGVQVADHHMVVDHAKPHCESHEYFNGILDDGSKGVFHGRIHVRQVAQKTDAKQTNKNVLLSDSATVNTKPQLEIYADDVKCTHGATIGQLDPQSIYYLRTRGIGEKRARQMLVHGFAGEIIDRIEYVPVREELDKLVWERLEDQSFA